MKELTANFLWTLILRDGQKKQTNAFKARGEITELDFHGQVRYSHIDKWLKERVKWRSVIEQKFVALTTEHTNKLRDKLLGLETVENQQTEKMVD